jgi:hypothetical protein
MIKKNKLSLLALAIASTLFFTACSQDAYSGFFDLMSGNVYSDNLGVSLPGESADEAIEAVDAATNPSSKTVTLTTLSPSEEDSIANGGEVDTTFDPDETFDDGDEQAVSSTTTLNAVVKSSSSLDSAFVNDKLGTDKLVILSDANGDKSVPKLSKKTKEEKDALTASLTTSNEKAKAALQKSLDEEETDPSTLLAAHNSSLIVANSLSAIKDELTDASGDSEEVLEIKKQLRDLTDKLTPTLPASPTKGDILDVQLALNVVNSLNDAFVAMLDGGSDLSSVDFKNAASDSDVVEKLISVLDDANAAISVANLNNENGDLIETIDIGSLIDSLSSKAISKGLSLTDEEQADINEQLESFAPTLKLLLESYVGIKSVNGSYVYDSTLNDANVTSNETISTMFTTFFTVDDMSESSSDLEAKLSNYDTFVGLDGIQLYFLTFFAENIDAGLDGLKDAYYDNGGTTVGDGSVEDLFNEYLSKHTNAFDSIFNGSSVDVMSFYYMDDSDDTVDPILDVISGSDFEASALLSKMLTQDELEEFIENCQIIIDRASSSDDNGILNDINDALEDFKNEIPSYYVSKG